MVDTDTWTKGDAERNAGVIDALYGREHVTHFDDCGCVQQRLLLMLFAAEDSNALLVNILRNWKPEKWARLAAAIVERLPREHQFAVALGIQPADTPQVNSPMCCAKCRRGDHGDHDAQDGCANDNSFNSDCACPVRTLAGEGEK